jgi:hypothetical protein
MGRFDRLTRGLRHLLLLSLLFSQALIAAPPPPTAVTGRDHGWDKGTAVDLSWEYEDPSKIEGGFFSILYSMKEEGPFIPAGETEGPVMEYAVTGLTPGQEYYFQVKAVDANQEESAPVTTEAITPRLQWFDGSRIWFLITVLIFCGSVVYFIEHARKGRPLKVRKIAGLEAVDEAVGRATEMGRSVIFVPGIQDMNDIQTIAGINVLSRVARTAAENAASLEVPTTRSLVMTTARETVQSAFLRAGRPEAFDENKIYYVTDEQFGYVAYLQGQMVREKPAACFYMGAFFAESLILAETGNSVGAIQVAGTAMPAQLPFFVASCDYTLIGEEFFAASAYLTGSPEELGSLKGQDVGKVLVAVGIIVGVLFATLASISGPEGMDVASHQLFQGFVDFLRGTVLN